MPRIKTIAVTPTAADPNYLSVSQTPAAGGVQILTMTGAGTTYDSDPDGIMTATSLANITPATDIITTIDTSLGAQGRSFTTPMFLTVLSAGDDSANFIVLGGMVRGRYIEETLALTNAGTAVSVNQFKSLVSVRLAAVSAGNVSIGTLGSTVLSQPQHINNTAAGNDSARTLTVVGTDRFGNDLTATMAGGNVGAAATTENFATVTKVSVDADTAGALEIGVDGTCESAWFPLSHSTRDFNVGVAVLISTGGAMTMRIEHTFNDVFAAAFVEDDAVVHVHETITAASANVDGNYTNPPVACRLALTAHTSGTGTLQVVQAG